MCAITRWHAWHAPTHEYSTWNSRTEKSMHCSSQSALRSDVSVLTNGALRLQIHSDKPGAMKRDVCSHTVSECMQCRAASWAYGVVFFLTWEQRVRSATCSRLYYSELTYSPSFYSYRKQKWGYYLGRLGEVAAEHPLKHRWGAWAHREDREDRGIGVAKMEMCTPIIASTTETLRSIAGADSHLHVQAECYSKALVWSGGASKLLLMNSLQPTIAQHCTFTSALCSTLNEFHIRCSLAAIMLRAQGIAISWVRERVWVFVCLFVFTLFCQTHQTRQTDASNAPEGAGAVNSELMTWWGRIFKHVQN